MNNQCFKTKDSMNNQCFKTEGVFIAGLDMLLVEPPYAMARLERAGPPYHTHDMCIYHTP